MAVDAQLVAELATGLGTLVLAVATFAAVRSSNRSARIAERSMLTGIRPLLLPSKLSDERQKVGFVDDHYVMIDGGHGSAEVDGSVVYLTMSVRNAGTGLALLDSWAVVRDPVTGQQARNPLPTKDFRRLTRDLYIPGGDYGFWQGAVRDESDPDFEYLRDQVKDGQAITLDVLYGDQDGEQHTISRFRLQPHEVDGEIRWLVSVSRHFYPDRADPR